MRRLRSWLSTLMRLVGYRELSPDAPIEAAQDEIEEADHTPDDPSLGMVIGYCAHCHANTRIIEQEITRLIDGRTTIRGICTVCEGRMIRTFRR